MDEVGAARAPGGHSTADVLARATGAEAPDKGGTRSAAFRLMGGISELAAIPARMDGETVIVMTGVPTSDIPGSSQRPRKRVNENEGATFDAQVE